MLFLLLINFLVSQSDEWSGCENGWIWGVGNTTGQSFAGFAASPTQCVDMVQLLCPGATIANMWFEGNGDCWCQYGEFILEDTSSRWKKCWIAEEKFSTCNQTQMETLAIGDSCHEQDVCGECESSAVCDTRRICREAFEQRVTFYEATSVQKGIPFDDASDALLILGPTQLLQSCRDDLEWDHVNCTDVVSGKDSLTITFRGSSRDLEAAMEDVNSIGLDLYPIGTIYTNQSTYELIHRGPDTCAPDQLLVTFYCSDGDECDELSCKVRCDDLEECTHFYFVSRWGCQLYECCTITSGINSPWQRGIVYEKRELSNSEKCADDSPKFSLQFILLFVLFGLAFVLFISIIIYYCLGNQALYSFDYGQTNSEAQFDDLELAPTGSRGTLPATIAQLPKDYELGQKLR